MNLYERLKMNFKDLMVERKDLKPGLILGKRWLAMLTGYIIVVDTKIKNNERMYSTIHTPWNAKHIENGSYLDNPVSFVNTEDTYKVIRENLNNHSGESEFYSLDWSELRKMNQMMKNGNILELEEELSKHGIKEFHGDIPSLF